MKDLFMTPEEMFKKREMRKKVMYVSFILMAGVLGAVVAIIGNTI